MGRVTLRGGLIKAAGLRVNIPAPKAKSAGQCKQPDKNVAIAVAVSAAAAVAVAAVALLEHTSNICSWWKKKATKIKT